MTIKYEDYLLELKDGRYDVLKKTTSKKKDTGESYESSTVLGYGLLLENALKKVINDRLENNLDVVTLEEAIKAYQKEMELLNKIING
jgi:hypothetical protein